MAQPPLDLHGRPLGVLRLSLTARCNLACPYCCPDAEDPPDLLTLQERCRVVESAVALGAHTLRLTGGEPLLHRRLEELIEALRPLRHRDRQDPRGRLGEIALTSNGVLLTPERARKLRAAGLDRITLSLDGTDAASVTRMAGLAGNAAGEAVLEKVLAAIRHARAAGFDPADGGLKLNAVITRHGNGDQLLPLAGLARELGVELRLIEFMDVGNRNAWDLQKVVPAAEMVARIGAEWPLEPVGRASHGTASRWRYLDHNTSDGTGGNGHLAVVASISAPFCGDCNRLRVTADGMAYTCLFASRGSDLRPWLRPYCDPAGLQAAMARIWTGRGDRWSEERLEGRPSAWADPATATHRPAHAEMAYLGG